MEPAMAVTIPASVLDGSSANTNTNSSTSFLALHETSLLPWHERAYADGPRPVPPPYSAAEKTAKWRRENAQYMRDVASGVRPRKKMRARQRRKKRAKVSAIDWSQRDQQVVNIVKQQVAHAYARCPCVQCTILQRENQPAVDYRCPVRYCNVQFRDFVELFEHQVAEHGRVVPHCRRVRMELFNQDRGVVPYPPVTVYAGQQLMRPGYCPTKWTLARVDEEAQTLHAQLFGKKIYAGALHVWDSFTMAYHQVRQGGVAQLDTQYAAALEYYSSSLVHPVTTRTFQDGADAVGDGRNWLLSPELAHAKRLTPFCATQSREASDCVTYRFAHRDGAAGNGDSANNDVEGDRDDDSKDSDDDEDSDGESTSTLLLETGKPVASIAPSPAIIVPAAVAKRLAAVPPWQRFLEPADVKIAHAIRVRKLTRPRNTPRCHGCGRQGHDNKSFGCSASKPRPIRRCTLCGEPGHKRQTCPNRVKSKSIIESAAVRCGNCGMRGHNRKNCYQVPLYGIGSATAI